MKLTPFESHDLGRAKRERRGELVRTTWVIQFREATGVEIGLDDFLALGETEDLRGRFFARLREVDTLTLHRTWALEERDSLSRFIESLAFLDERVVLLSEMDNLVGAALVPLAPVLKHMFAVWQLVGEDLCVATVDLRSGLCIESPNHFDIDGQYRPDTVFEVKAWGRFHPDLSG